MEKAGFIKPIPLSVIYSEPCEVYDYPYPLNFDERDKALFHSEHSYKTYSTSDLEVFELTNVGVTYEGIIFKGLKICIAALPHPVFANKYGWLYLLGKRLGTEKNRSSEKCILVYDHWSMINYYHWMIDSLPRLWLAKKNLGDALILLPENAPAFITNSLKYFDDARIKHIGKTETLLFDKFYLQNYAAASGHQHKGLLKEIRNKILTKVPDKFDYKRIYVSRAKQVKRKIVNEDEILKLVLDRGFTVVYFEDHSLEEQIQLMKKAQVLVSGHGANLTNMMFMPEKASIFELIRNDQPNFCYWSMSNSLGFDYYYQLCEIQDVDNIRIDIEKFKENLNQIIK
ncbi:MAG TPA: glycosyltransferase family 61 protein [Bacteroidia bacterium]